jgi:hypothetical protein
VGILNVGQHNIKLGSKETRLNKQLEVSEQALKIELA